MSIINRIPYIKLLCVMSLTLAFASDTFSAPQTCNLLDYRGPLTADTTWLYSGSIYTRAQIISTKKTITSYTNGASSTPYSTNVISIKYDYGTSNPDGSFSSEDEWYEYITVDANFHMWGDDDDDDESLRIDGGLNFGSFLAIGDTNNDSALMYDNGSYIGVVNGTVKLIDVANVTVPAGTFTNCLHLRFTLTIGNEIGSWDEWWASGVGTVKMVAISGVGSGKNRVLEWYNFTVVPPVDPPVDPPMNHQSNNSGLLLLLLDKD